MLDIHADAVDDTYNYPGDDMFLALKGVEREAHFMAVQRAEALSEILIAHLSPLSQDSTELRAVFNAEPGAAPAITGQVPSEWADGDSGQGAASGLEQERRIRLDALSLGIARRD